MPGRRRIAVMIGGLGLGGSERQLYLFLAHCDRMRWDPVLYVSGALGAWETPFRDLRFPIVLLRGNPVSKMRQFRSAAIAQRPDCFFSWSSYTNGYALALAGLPTRRIGSFRNADFSDLPEQLRQVWRWMSLRSISVAVCNSGETRAAIARYAGPRLETLFVPNAVEIPAWDHVQTSRRHWRGVLGLPDDTVLVVGAGRLVPQKCFSRFIDAIAQVSRDYPVQAVIAGEDHGCLSALVKQTARLGLQSTVRFIGPVPDARELIAAADIHLLSSDYEGMPNVVLEAMAAGVPSVSTRVNAVGDLIKPGVTGFIAEHDAADLAQHVLLLAKSRSLRQEIGTQGRSLVEQAYRSEQIFPRLWLLCGQPVPAEVVRS